MCRIFSCQNVSEIELYVSKADIFGRANVYNQMVIGPEKYYVLDCYFEVKHLISHSDGEAIESINAIILMVESSSFFNCQTSHYGGAIFYSIREKDNIHCVICKTCALGCISSDNGVMGHFCYIDL